MQSVIGSITGNPGDQKAADQKKAEAAARDDLSKAGGNIGGVSVSASGVAANDPNRQAGSWNQNVGSAKEAVGGFIGNENLKQAGQQQNAEGKSQEAQGQLSDLGKGVTDRVAGAVGGAVAGVTGDREAAKAAERQHDTGKTLQRGAEADIQKQGPQA